MLANLSFCKLVKKDFIIFLLVGLINTIFGYTIFVILINLKMYYPVALFLSTIMGVAFNFKTTGSIVFGSRDNSLIFRFIAVYIVLYLINLGILRIFNLLGFDLIYSGALSIFPVAILSYLLNKRFVFVNKN